MMGLMSPCFRSSAKSLRRPATNSALNDRLRLRRVDPIRLALLRSRTPRLALSATAPAQPASEDQDTVHTTKVCSLQSNPCTSRSRHAKLVVHALQVYFIFSMHKECSKPDWISKHARQHLKAHRPSSRCRRPFRPLPGTPSSAPGMALQHSQG